LGVRVIADCGLRIADCGLRIFGEGERWRRFEGEDEKEEDEGG